LTLRYTDFMNSVAELWTRRIVVSLPLLLGLTFIPALASPFSVPKTAIFVLLSFVFGGLVLSTASDLKMREGERNLWIAVLVYIAIVVTCAAVSPLRYLSTSRVAFATGGLLLFGAARFVLAGKTRALLLTISGTATLVALFTIAQFWNLDLLAFSGVSGVSASRMRMYSTLGNPNFVASFLAAAVPAPIALALGKCHQRAPWIVTSLVIAMGIVLTGSRAGVLALVAAVVVFGAITIRNRVAWWSVIAGLAIVCVCVAIVHFNPRTATESLHGRYFIWKVTLADGAARSALGSGPGSFGYLYPIRMGRFFSDPSHANLLRYAGHERHAQNDFVEAWHDTGWLGLTSLLAIFGLWLGLMRIHLRDEQASVRAATATAVAGVAALLVTAMFDFPLHRAETWTLLWLWMAVPFAKQESPTPRALRFVPVRCFGAGLLIVVGGCFAFVQVASSYWLRQGQIQEREGHVEAARKSYRSALRWERESPDANFNFVRAMAKTGDLSGALAQSHVASRFVNEPELIILRSRIQQNIGNIDLAMHELQSGMRMFPYSQELREELASYSSIEVTTTDR
jgi:O-antigen ligase